MHTRIRSEKTKLKSTLSRSRLFDQPFLLEGEDAAVYNKLLSDVRAAIKPIDIIDDIFVSGVVADEWEVLRWRRLKTNLMRELMLTALKDFLREKADNTRRIANILKQILEESFPSASRDFAQLADACARNETDAVNEVSRVLRSLGLNLETLVSDVETVEVEKLVRAYVRHEPDAVAVVNERLEEAGTSMDRILAGALADSSAFIDRLNNIERIDRSISIAEQRRNASLHEIERRRPVLADALRRTVQGTEERELKLIDTTASKGDAA
jgi:hypothetical protein